MIHVSATIEDGVAIDASVRVWANTHIRKNASIGESSIIGEGVYIGEGVTIGKNCKIQNNSLVYEPAIISDGVFIGPGAVLTNDQYPRAINPDGTLKNASDWSSVGVKIDKGASIGAGAICVAPVSIGAWSSVAAGSVVVREVEPFQLVAGIPAKFIGWVGRSGLRLTEVSPGLYECPRTGERYAVINGKMQLQT